MKKLLFTFVALLAGIGAFAQSAGMQLRHSEVIGDAMGEQKDQITQWTKPYYDKDGRLVREAVYGRCLDGSIELTRYTTYEYNEKGQLASKSSQQYGVFDGEDFAFRASNDTTVYEYDAAGNILSEVTQEYERKDYTYDNAGNLVKKVRSMFNSGQWKESEVTEYYDFVNGQPTKLNNIGQWSSYIYVGEIAYDEKGNKVKELHYNNWEEKKLTGNSFYWTYDKDGNLSLYEKKYVNGNGEEVDQLRTIYTTLLAEADKERISVKTQTYSVGAWYNEPTSIVREYAKYNHADYAPELSAEKFDDENRIKVVITLPKQAVADGDKAALKIMDNGLLLDIVTVAQAREKGMLSADGKTITYITDIFRNGDHEMLAQYVQANGEIVNEETTTDWNISNQVKIVLNKFLPAASNIQAIEADRDKDGYYSLSVKWDAAPDAEAYGLIRYNVMVQGFSVPDNFDEELKCLDLTWTFMYLEEPVTFMIQAVYPYGKANTEYVTMDPKRYLQVVDDNRICVEEERTYAAGNKEGYDAGTVKVEKFFINDNNKLLRSAVYNKDAEGKLMLEGYSKYDYDGDVVTKTTGEDIKQLTYTYTEAGKINTVTEDVQEGSAKYQYVSSYNYNMKDGSLETIVVKRAKYNKSNALGSFSNYAQTIYTNDPDNDYVVYGSYSIYDAMKAKWTEVATVKRSMIYAGNDHTTTASALEVTKDHVVISAIPAMENLNGLAAFNIFRDGEIVAEGLSIFDENYLKQSESGDFIDWNYTDMAPEGKDKCEYIVQFATLDNYMNFDRAYYSSNPFVVDFANASGIKNLQTTKTNNHNGTIYNLNGQKVGNNYSGIVIKNGKKIIK